MKEYENAAHLTFRVDELRDKLSTFFLTFAGAAVAAVVLILKGEFNVDLFGDKRLTASLFLTGVSFIGFLIVCIHARLRRVQLENFSMISRIRLYCLHDNMALWRVIGLSPATLPRIRLTNWSGSELWALTILLPTVGLFSGGLDLFLRWGGMTGWWHSVPVAIALIAIVVLWKLFVKFASEPKHPEVTVDQVKHWLQQLELITPTSAGEAEAAVVGDSAGSKQAVVV